MLIRYCLFCCWDPSSSSSCSTTPVVSGEPAIRNARAIARRRIAVARQSWSGCNHAPRPGRLPAVSTTTTYPSSPSGLADILIRSAANSRFRHPTHVRTGPRGLRCGRVPASEDSCWITIHPTCLAECDLPPGRELGPGGSTTTGEVGASAASGQSVHERPIMSAAGSGVLGFCVPIGPLVQKWAARLFHPVEPGSRPIGPRTWLITGLPI